MKMDYLQMFGINFKDYTPLAFNLSKMEMMEHKIQVHQVNKKLGLAHTLHRLGIIKLKTVFVEKDIVRFVYE